VEVDVEIRFWGVEGGEEVKERVVQRAVVLRANGTTDKVLTGKIDTMSEAPHVLAAKMWHRGEIVARDMDWPQPLKYLSFPQRNVRVQQDGESIHVSADRPVKCLVFEERDGYALSANALDLAPGDEQVIQVTGAKEGDSLLDWTYLGQDEQQGDRF
jgi:beta-mannosidase